MVYRSDGLKNFSSKEGALDWCQAGQTSALCLGTEDRPEYCVRYGPVYVADKTGEASRSLVIGLGVGEGFDCKGSLGLGDIGGGLVKPALI